LLATPLIPLTTLAPLFTGGCSVQTEYQQLGHGYHPYTARDTGGFSEMRHADDDDGNPTYTVKFEANTRTQMATVWDFATLRAADIGFRFGYTWMAVEESKGPVKSSYNDGRAARQLHRVTLLVHYFREKPSPDVVRRRNYLNLYNVAEKRETLAKKNGVELDGTAPAATSTMK
jgi:hypothetical protein